MKKLKDELKQLKETLPTKTYRKIKGKWVLDFRPDEQKGLCKVYKIYLNSGRKRLLHSGVSETEAQRLVNSYPSTDKTMAVYYNLAK